MNTPHYTQNGESVPGNIRSRSDKDRIIMLDNRNIEKKYDTFKIR